MAQSTMIHEAVELLVSDDGLSASIVIDPEAAPYGLDPAELHKILESAGIVSASEDHLRRLATQKGRIVARAPLTIHQGVLPRAGRPAMLRLLPSLSPDMQVEPGLTLGTVDPGDEGSPGLDVFNRKLAPYRPADPFRVGTGVSLTPDQRLVASSAGRFTVLPDQTVAVLPAVSVPGDLTSQNIGEFAAAPSPTSLQALARIDGDLIVAGAVRDTLRLEVMGSVDVTSAVDADSITTGQDLRCAGGLLGGGLHGKRGHYSAGRDLSARFATGSHLRVSRNLEIVADLMHCHVVCGGTARIRERIHGCIVVATAGIHCHSATASVQQPTHLEAGSDPALRLEAERALSALQDDLQKVEHSRLTISPLLARMDSLTPAQRQQAARLVRETSRLEEHILQTTQPLRDRYQAYKSVAVHEIHVADTLQAGVVVRFPGLEATIPTSFRGPLKVIPDRSPGEPRVHVIDLRSHTSHALPARILPDPILFQLTKVMQKIA
jgi:hypothetical protein